MSSRESMNAAVFLIFSSWSGFSFTLASFATTSGFFRNFILKSGSLVACSRRSLRFFSSFKNIRSYLDYVV